MNELKGKVIFKFEKENGLGNYMHFITIHLPPAAESVS
jgi:hypothetical protein